MNIFKRKTKSDFLAEYNEMNSLEAEMKHKIHQYYDELIANFDINKYYKSKSNHNLDFEVGSVVIPNIFDLRFSSTNKWDGGINSLLTSGGAEMVSYKHNIAETIRSFYCKITDIVVERTFVDDLVNNFLNTYDFQESKLNEKNIIDFYRKNILNFSSNKIFDHDGLYVSVFFDTLNFEFNPEWSLNVFSFLNLESQDGYATLKKWNEAYSIRQKINSLNDEKYKLNNELKLLLS